VTETAKGRIISDPAFFVINPLMSAINLLMSVTQEHSQKNKVSIECIFYQQYRFHQI